MGAGRGGRRPAKPRAKNSKAANRGSRGVGRPPSGGGRISKRRSQSFSANRGANSRPIGGRRSLSDNDASNTRVGRDRSRGNKDGKSEDDGGDVVKKRGNLKALRRERWGAQKAAAHKKSCEEGRKKKAEDDKRREAAIARGEKPPARKHAPNKRLRVKGGEQRDRLLVVRRAGDPHPKARGRIPVTDLAVKTDAFDDDMFVPRKARELFAPPPPSEDPSAIAEKKTNKNSNKVFDSMQKGETLEGFKSRITAEAKQARLDLARTDNHQRQKKRAYFERRKEKADRKKRRKKGIYSDEEEEDGAVVEDDNDAYDNDNNNNGALTAIIDIMHERMAESQRKRKSRKRKNRDDELTPWDSPRTTDNAPRFGEQAMRPPLLSCPPTMRGGKSLPNKKKNNVVASNAYHLIKQKD